jgi:HlyD family secretion protein
MANPERLDAPLRLVGRAQWLILATVVVFIALALAWALLTQAPVKVAANGILIDRAGLIEIVASDGGRLQAVSIAPGDTVEAGAVVATLARTDLERELREIDVQRAAAEERLGRLTAFYGEQSAREGAADEQQLATIRGTRAALEERLAALQEKLKRVQSLVEKGYAPNDLVIDTQIDVADVGERLSRLADEATKVEVGAVQREGRNSLALRDEQRTVDELRRSAERLRTQLAEQQSIVAASAGQVVEVKVGVGDVIAAGSSVATLTPVEQDDTMQALLYVPAGEGKRIRPGMPAEIVPSTVERERYGHIVGEVVTVAPLPATAAGMRRVLRNDQLVEQLRAGGAPIEVRIALARDSATRTGFAWSSSRGPAAGTTVGTLVDGRVVVGHVPVISWLVPGAGGSDE